MHVAPRIFSFAFIQGGLHWSVSDHLKVIFNAQTNVGWMDGLEISERQSAKITDLRRC